MKATNSIQDFVQSSAILGRIKTPPTPSSSPKSIKEELKILAYFETRGNLSDKNKLAKTLILILNGIKSSHPTLLGLDYDFIGFELYKLCHDKESARKAIRLLRRISRFSISPSQIYLALDIPLQRLKRFSNSNKVNNFSQSKAKYPPKNPLDGKPHEQEKKKKNQFRENLNITT